MTQGTTADERVAWMYESAFTRRPTEPRDDSGSRVPTTSPDEAAEKPSDIDRLSDFAHALINAKEFIFLR